jgi:hypothetical protein
MKKYSHAFVALMALKRLDGLKNSFDTHFKKQASSLVKFFGKYRDAFVQGAWFPDNPIKDNVLGGHTWKYKLPKTSKENKKARPVSYRPPKHTSCISLIDKKRLEEKVVLMRNSSLPDRCEALRQAIRDMVKIQKKEEKGSPIIFNDNQIALYFLMLSHYIADAHTPPHCDARDFYEPSKIHPDMEKFWEKEIRKYYEFIPSKQKFLYDKKGNPELKQKKAGAYKNSFLFKAEQRLNRRKWYPSYGKGNTNFWDYIVGVCFISYLVSTTFIPLDVSKPKYTRLRILEDKKYRKNLESISEHIFADTIDSIALLWLLTWDSYFKLEEEVKKKKGKGVT